MLLSLFLSALSVSVAHVNLSAVLAVLAATNSTVGCVSFDCCSLVRLLQSLVLLPVNCTTDNLLSSFAAASADQHVDPARAFARIS